MSEFKSCKGKNECRDDGVNCLVCGRSLEEVAQTQQLVQGLTDLALAKGYENIDDFADYVARRIRKKVAHARDPKVAQA